MTIEERVELYKKLFPECKALDPVRAFVMPTDRIQALEAIRELGTELAKAYKVRLPVITAWVRDDSYVSATEEIYLTEPDLEGYLHQFRHHLQNEARLYERRYLLLEDNKDLDDRIPYKDANSLLAGEDDAKAWARFLIESV